LWTSSGSRGWPGGVVNGALRIGCLVTFSDLLDSALVRDRVPLLAEMAGMVASVGIRNRATLVGNICAAVPCCDGGPALLADAAERARVRRYILISSMGAGAEPPEGTDEVFAAYLRAKRASEEDLRDRSLDWTILRPGRLTNDPGTGLVDLRPSVERGAVPRDDVASVVLGLLHEPRTSGSTLELVSGDTPIVEAIAAVA
jgi:hypothetical protein